MQRRHPALVAQLAEMQELMAIARSAALPDLPLTQRPRADATAALEDLRAGRVRGRIILKTSGSAQQAVA
ncbi:MAG: hypothetical protein ACK5Y8_20965 [Betaproteobacteria bacterium]